MAQEHILIVEDSPFLANAISKVLTGMGCETTIVSTGEDALNALESQDPDLVVLDWILPGIQGIDLLREIRSGPRADTWVIMLTARGELESRLEGLDAGADDYIVKPVHMNELRARIAALLRRTG